jgi:hypothetical protein
VSNFVLYSIVGSIVLTLLVNLLPLLFPKSSQRAKDKIVESVQAQRQAIERGEKPRVRVFFPWKWMLIGSIVLTILINVIAVLAGR